jgi:hypothetical protein
MTFARKMGASTWVGVKTSFISDPHPHPLEPVGSKIFGPVPDLLSIFGPGPDKIEILDPNLDPEPTGSGSGYTRQALPSSMWVV